MTNDRARLAAKIGAGAAALTVALVAAWEGYKPTVYADPIGRTAVCYGHDDPTLVLGQTYTRAQCEGMLADDLFKHAQALRCVTKPMSEGQRAAFVSFAYNVGEKQFCASTLVKKANAGDMAGACAEISRWTYAGGRYWQGLANRRAAERAVCEGKY